MSLNLGRNAPGKSSGKAEKKDEVRNWYKDRFQVVSVQRNVLALVTFVSLVGVLLSSLAISQLTPLKSVEPFVIQVEDKTGVTQVVDPVKASELTSDEAVNQYFIVKYIVAREAFNRLTINDSSNTVRVLSVPRLYYDYQSTVDATNPKSRYNMFALGGARTVSIRSISFLPQGNDTSVRTAQARILIEEKANNQDRKLNQIVTLSFQYAKLSLTAEERYINPLGFQVVGYRIDDEATVQ